MAKGETLPDAQTIAARAVQGSMFTVGASLITLVSGFVRSVLLARLLLPEYFGVMTLALFFLSLTMQVQRFGLNTAFIHRQDDSPANLATFASLRVGLTAVAVLISLIAAPILGRLYSQQRGLAMIFVVLAIFELINAFNAVPQVLLSKGLHFGRLAILDVASSVTMTIVAPAVAWLGGGVRALVVERITGILMRTGGLWLYRRPWAPNFGLDRELTRWYLRFGAFVFANANLSFLLNKFDDFWTGTFLGATSLGLYSRAYEFALYPRRLLAGPIMRVFLPVFAQLQSDRLRLSKAFYRVNSLIIRVGFLTFGAFVLVAPEFIRIFLGEKWLPMSVAFQLMLAYTLLDPLVSVSTNLLVAVGQPKIIMRIQMVRIAIFVPAVIVLAYSYGINGVAVAADLMLVVGIGLLFKRTKEYVDFSLARMFLVPFLGLALAVSTAILILAQLNISSSAMTILVKTGIITVIYGVVLIVFEREESLRAAGIILDLLVRRRQATVL